MRRARANEAIRALWKPSSVRENRQRRRILPVRHSARHASPAALQRDLAHIRRGQRTRHVGDRVPSPGFELCRSSQGQRISRFFRRGTIDEEGARNQERRFDRLAWLHRVSRRSSVRRAKPTRGRETGPRRPCRWPRPAKTAIINQLLEQTSEHSRWGGYLLIGKTPAGPMTVATLDLDHPRGLPIRHTDELVSLFPPQS
jgi:hypothetical protein